MPPATGHAYLIALGSNRRHHRFGRPRDVLAAALERLGAEGVRVIAAAPVLLTEPLGPSLRRYANSAAVIETRLDPPALLALLKRIEREFGRRPGGQRWTSRVLDLDVILWSGGPFAAPALTIPHPCSAPAASSSPLPSRSPRSGAIRSRASRFASSTPG